MNTTTIRLAAIVLVSTLFSVGCASTGGGGSSRRASFNADWRFQKNDPPGAPQDKLAYAKAKPMLLPTAAAFSKSGLAMRRPDASFADDVTFTRADFDDHAWR